MLFSFFSILNCNLLFLYDLATFLLILLIGYKDAHANRFLQGVVYVSLLPTVFRPIKLTDQLVSFPVLVVTNSAVLHLLGAELVESGTRMLTQSPVLVCI